MRAVIDGGPFVARPHVTAFLLAAAVAVDRRAFLRVCSGTAARGRVLWSARNLGYDAVILRGCVGSRSRELHELALKLMEQTHFHIAAAAEIAALWPAKK